MKVLIKNFNSAKKRYDNAENKLSEYFNSLYNERIRNSKTIEELTEIKEELRKMPECAGKVFLFYDIITRENHINKPKT